MPLLSLPLTTPPSTIAGLYPETWLKVEWLRLRQVLEPEERSVRSVAAR